jgi:thioredoxin 1
MSILTLKDEESLDYVLGHHDTVVIDFWAPWCAPCKGFLPILEKASERHPDIVFCRVDSDEQKSLAQAFEVESIPTLVVIRERVLVAAQPGMLPEDVLEDLIGKVKALDMDEVRREIEGAEKATGDES